MSRRDGPGPSGDARRSERAGRLRPAAPLRELLPLFADGLVPIVVEDDEFLGLVTRMDVVNFLRRRLG